MNNEFVGAGQIAAFERALRLAERAEATTQKYLRDVRAFSRWLKGRPLCKEMAAGWKERLIGQGLSPATVNGKLSALNGLLRFLGRGDCRVKFLKLQRRVFRDASRELTREEYGRLVAAAEKGGNERLALLMQAICATGIRVSEVRYLTVEAAKAGRAVISLKGKIRTILLPAKLCRKLLRFARRQKICSGEIFLNESGAPLSRYQIWKSMKSFCGAAGIAAGKVFPHNLRHLFAVAFYRATRDIVQLADILGHSSVETTRIYLLTTGAEHARRLEQLGLVT